MASGASDLAVTVAQSVTNAVVDSTDALPFLQKIFNWFRVAGALGLQIFSLITTILVIIDYWKNGDIYFFSLSLVFLVAPIFVQSLIDLMVVSVGNMLDGNEGFCKKYSKFFKFAILNALFLRLTAEYFWVATNAEDAKKSRIPIVKFTTTITSSVPQLLLQVYIIRSTFQTIAEQTLMLALISASVSLVSIATDVGPRFGGWRFDFEMENALERKAQPEAWVIAMQKYKWQTIFLMTIFYLFDVGYRTLGFACFATTFRAYVFLYIPPFFLIFGMVTIYLIGFAIIVIPAILFQGFGNVFLFYPNVKHIWRMLLAFTLLHFPIDTFFVVISLYFDYDRLFMIFCAVFGGGCFFSFWVLLIYGRIRAPDPDHYGQGFRCI